VSLAESARKPRSSAWGALTRTIEIQVLFSALVLFAVFAGLYPESFATTGTLLNMARVAAILLVVAVGQTFPLISGGFDISVASTMGLVSIVISQWMVGGGGVLSGVALGVATGALVGIANGLIVAVLDVTPFITTLGTLTFVRGLADELGNGGSIIGLPAALGFWGRNNWGPMPSAAVISVLGVVLAWLLLERTRFGLYLFAMGGSREAARIAGVRVRRAEVLAYVVCGAYAGLAGVILTARVSIGQASLGRGFDLLSIATAVIGGVAIGGGVGRLSGVVAGAILLTVLTTGLDIAGVNSFYQQMATGAVLVLAVTAANARRLWRVWFPKGKWGTAS
jgi:ribose transport system permease protein